MFTEHAVKLVEVAELAVSMAEDQAGVRMVRQAAAQVATLYKQVKFKNVFPTRIERISDNFFIHRGKFNYPHILI